MEFKNITKIMLLEFGTGLYWCKNVKDGTENWREPTNDEARRLTEEAFAAMGIKVCLKGLISWEVEPTINYTIKENSIKVSNKK